MRGQRGTLFVRDEVLSAVPPVEWERGPMAGMGGNCFEAALGAAVALRDQDPLICHGQPIGTGPLNGGRRYWHAWVEVQVGNGWNVVDVSSNKRMEVRRSVYYKRGRIDPDAVLRFTIADARKAVAHYDHMGPWVDQPRADEAL